MTKRLKIIIAIGVAAIISVSTAMLRIHKYQTIKEIETIYIGRTYRMQNEALVLDYNTKCYLPYTQTEDSERRKRLQVYFNAFEYKTGKVITIEDVKEFLKEPYNEDGSPRTFENDTSIVREYIDWYFTCDDYWDVYMLDIIGITARYSVRYDDEKIVELYDLSLDQINELCSLYTGDEDTYPYDKLREAWEKYDKN